MLPAPFARNVVRSLLSLFVCCCACSCCIRRENALNAKPLAHTNNHTMREDDFRCFLSECHWRIFPSGEPQYNCLPLSQHLKFSSALSKSTVFTNTVTIHSVPDAQGTRVSNGFYSRCPSCIYSAAYLVGSPTNRTFLNRHSLVE